MNRHEARVTLRNAVCHQRTAMDAMGELQCGLELATLDDVINAVNAMATAKDSDEELADEQVDQILDHLQVNSMPGLYNTRSPDAVSVTDNPTRNGRMDRHSTSSRCLSGPLQPSVDFEMEQDGAFSVYVAVASLDGPDGFCDKMKFQTVEEMQHFVGVLSDEAQGVLKRLDSVNEQRPKVEKPTLSTGSSQVDNAVIDSCLAGCRDRADPPTLGDAEAPAPGMAARPTPVTASVRNAR